MTMLGGNNEKPTLILFEAANPSMIYYVYHRKPIAITTIKTTCTAWSTCPSDAMSSPPIPPIPATWSPLSPGPDDSVFWKYK